MTDRTDTIVHRWFEEVWNQGREQSIDDMMTVDTVMYGLEEEVVGPEAFRKFYRKFRGAFPDMRITVEQAVVDGDLIAARCVATATHDGPGLTETPTGNPLRITGMVMAREADDKIIEAWNNFDFLSLYQQIGIRLT